MNVWPSGRYWGQRTDSLLQDYIDSVRCFRDTRYKITKADVYQAVHAQCQRLHKANTSIIHQLQQQTHHDTSSLDYPNMIKRYGVSEYDRLPTIHGPPETGLYRCSKRFRFPNPLGAICFRP